MMRYPNRLLPLLLLGKFYVPAAAGDKRDSVALKVPVSGAGRPLRRSLACDDTDVDDWKLTISTGARLRRLGRKALSH